MDRHECDVVVIGAGMAGATAAAALSATHRVALVEAETVAGYHTTGRSAAMWILNYGPPNVRVLTGLSRDFYENPPAGFTDSPLMVRRPKVFLAPPGQEAELAALLADGLAIAPASIGEIRDLVPALRTGYASAGAVEADAFDMEVAAIHAGFLRQLARNGGVLALDSRSRRIERRDGAWEVLTSQGTCFRAPVLVNAAGAWGDEIARQADVAPLGLTPMRRTAMIIDPAPWNVVDWPMIGDVGHTWYVRPEARTRLLVCPCDETPMPPQDVAPDELDVAIGIDRMQQALAIDVHRVVRKWAGLRTFAPDRDFAFGWDRDRPGFFWCVGQGGYGIQTAPAAGRLVADWIAGRDPGAAGAIMANIDAMRFYRHAEACRGAAGTAKVTAAP